MEFWVDDEARTLTLLDNAPLTVTRLDRFWISADRNGIFYEFDRRDGTLTYVNWPPFRPDSRHNLEGLRLCSSTGLCLTIINELN